MIHILNTRYCLLDEVERPAPGKRVELDHGCGSGGFTVRLAESKPEALVFGADVMLGRLRKVEKLGRRTGVSNLELLRVEARHLISLIAPDSYFDRIHILCPDPWPKHKHKGNRLMSSDFMMQLNRVLKKDGILINCARGGIVDEEALNKALDENWIHSAGTDVVVHEPIDPADPIFSHDNIVVSPHMAGQTREAASGVATLAAEGTVAVINGEKWDKVCNPKAYDHARWQK